MAVSVKVFLAEVETIAAEEPAYQKGHDGHDGLCDCIGLIVGAIRRAGGEWRGLHGSNYAARSEMTELLPIGSAGELRPGEVVYKAYEPNQGGYNLSKRYNKSRDKRDYYHIGVVVSVKPLMIRHMTAPKPRIDTKLGKWGYHGKLKKIDYSSEGGQILERVIIRGGNMGEPIHMRKGASTKTQIVIDIPQGSEAVLLGNNGDWCQIAYAGQSGYVMTKFVSKADGSAPTPVQDGETITVNRKRVEEAYDILGDLLGYRG